MATALGSVDLFHLRTHRELRAAGLAGNGCAVVAQLEGRLDRAALAARLSQASRAMPELRWQLKRDLRLNMTWRPSGKPLTAEYRSQTGALIPAVAELLEEPLSARRPWHLDVLHGPQSDAVVLRWFHSISDARGATRLLRWLGSGDAPPSAAARWMTGDRIIERCDRAKRRELMEGYISHVFELGQRPILSLHRATGRPRKRGHLRAVRLRFSEAETTAFDASVRRRAGLADTSLILYAAGRMVDELLRQRGFSPPQQLVPVPMSLDPKRGCQRMFGNHLTMMMLSLDREALAQEKQAVVSLAKQRRDIVRAELDRGMLAAMHTTRHMPRHLVDWLSRRPFGGQRSSYVLSNPGKLELDTFMGRRVTDAFALPTALPMPGLVITADRHHGRLSLLWVFRDSTVNEAEIRARLPSFSRDLLGSQPTPAS